MTERLRPREAIARMDPYHPPTSGRLGKQRHDFNENTLGCSPRVLAKLREVATPEYLATYPEYGESRARIASFLGVSSDQLVLCDGTDEGIHVLMQTYVDARCEVIIPWPAFPMFRFYAQVAGAEPRLTPYREPGLSFPEDELLSAIGPATRAILIASPNNPTGGVVELDSIRRILAAAPRAAVLIDEAYFEFHGVTALDLIPEHPNLFVSRTFSKAYGLAGMRVGCVISQAENIAVMRKGQSPYSVNALAAACAAEAVCDQEFVANFVREVCAARQRLGDALSKWGIPYWPSRANFILAQFGDRATTVVSDMRARGFLLRDRSSEFPGAVRITLGDQRQTGNLLAALEAVLGE